MMTFDEACKLAGYDSHAIPPEQKSKYLAYKSGEVKEFANRLDVATFSSLYERVVSNQDELDAFWKKQQHLNNQAVKIWYDDLRAEHYDLTDEQFSLVYGAAYEEVHGDGYDVIAEKFVDLYDLCVKFVSLKAE